MAEELAFENGRISNFEELVTLTFDRLILHTIVHHSSTSNYKPNFVEIEETFCRRTDVPTHVRTYARTALLGGLCQRVDLKTTGQSDLTNGRIAPSTSCSMVSSPKTFRLNEVKILMTAALGLSTC